MKKPYMHTIINAPGRDCVLIILFQLYGWALMLGFLKVIYSGWEYHISINIRFPHMVNQEEVSQEQVLKHNLSLSAQCKSCIKYDF